MAQIRYLCTRKDQEKKFWVCLIFNLDETTSSFQNFIFTQFNHNISTSIEELGAGLGINEVINLTSYYTYLDSYVLTPALSLALFLRSLPIHNVIMLLIPGPVIGFIGVFSLSLTNLSMLWFPKALETVVLQVGLGLVCQAVGGLAGWCLLCEIMDFETHPASMILKPFPKYK